MLASVMVSRFQATSPDTGLFPPDDAAAAALDEADGPEADPGDGDWPQAVASIARAAAVRAGRAKLMRTMDLLRVRALIPAEQVADLVQGGRGRRRS